MAKKKRTSNPQREVPRVRIAEPKGRPFQIRYTCPEQKREVRVSVGSRDMAEAERMKGEIEAKLVLGIQVSVGDKKVRGPEMTWESFREEYRQHHLNPLRDKTAGDAESRLDIATRIINPKTLGEFAEPSTLQTLQSRILAGEQSRRGKPRSIFTARGYMKSILAALNWAYYQNLLAVPPKVPRLKVAKKKAMKGRPITEAEFESLLKATPLVVGEEAADSWTAILYGLWESALRIEELMHVSWDIQETIRPNWNDGKFPVLEIPAKMQKNDTDENISLLPGFERLLLQTPIDQRTGWAFNPISLQMKFSRKSRYERLEAGWVGKVISRIGMEAGIEVAPKDDKTGSPIKFASAHDLRRSCGQRLRNAGVPPLVICRVMRHSSWETTQRHYAPGDIQSDAEALRDALKVDGNKRQGPEGKAT